MVFVASSEFVTAAEAQSRALGADPARVFVPHPIQDRTDDELRALADAAFREIVEALLAEHGCSVERFAKPTFTKPAPIDLRHEIATKCDVIVEALAD